MGFEIAPDENAYDYIIVGSGAGGGPLACRLAREGADVLLIEAGPDHESLGHDYTNDVYDIPAFHTLSTEAPNLSWNYRVDHYSNTAQAKRDTKYTPKGHPTAEPKVFYPRAGVLGGCTSHYAMITVAPHNSDWDAIKEITKDKSWSAKEMQKYHKRVEEWLSIEPVGRTEAVKLGIGAPQFLKILLGAAFNEGGFFGGLFSIAGNLNKRLLRGSDPTGPFRIPTATDGTKYRPKGVDVKTAKNHRGGTREYIRAVHDECAAGGENTFDIQTDCFVTRVILDDENTAVGVRYRIGRGLYAASKVNGAAVPGEEAEVRVRPGGEVILSCGAFNTPQLLMLSGIGPTETLRGKGIERKVPLEGVGKNLQDRYEVGVVGRYAKNFEFTKDLVFRPPNRNIGEVGDPAYLRWKDGDGGLYSTNGAILTLVRKSRAAAAENGDADLFIFGVPGHFKGYYDSYSSETTAHKDEFTWVVLKAHTKNTGQVTLDSPDPFAQPKINFAYFGDYPANVGNPSELPRDPDLDATAEGVEMVRRMNAALGDTFVEYVVPQHPGPNQPPTRGAPRKTDPDPFDTEEKRKRFVMDEAWGHHASCTCPIGPDDDPMAVLDKNFQVRGAKNLRVVDASVFPTIPGFFIVLPIYMISEKASDVILAAGRARGLID